MLLTCLLHARLDVPEFLDPQKPVVIKINAPDSCADRLPQVLVDERHDLLLVLAGLQLVGELVEYGFHDGA